MKRWTNKKNRIRKTLMMALLCSSLVISIPVGIPVVNATDATSTAESGDDDVDANGKLGKNSDIRISVKDSVSYKVGEKKKPLSFTVKSGDSQNIKLKSVYPVIDTAFPFETSGDAYKVVSAGSDEEKQKSMEASFKLAARSDLTTGYQSVRFVCEYRKLSSDNTWVDYYVIKTINVSFTGKVDQPAGNGGGGSGGDDDGGDDDGGDDDGSPYYGGSGSDDGGSDSSGEVSAPKLLITGYDTKPEKIMAGEKFTLTIHLRNTSKSTAVCNGKFLIGNEAGNFLPTSGSSAVFIEKIEPDKTGDLKIEMKTSSDLAQKNYSLVVKGDFDDGKGNAFTSSDSLSIPVYQEVKLAVTDVSMSPEMIGIGMEGNLMFTINNQGNAGVYNVMVSVDDPAVTCEDSYVGNIAASSSAYATLNLVGEKDNSDTGKIKVTITYEDAEGTAGKFEQEMECFVGEDFMSDIGGDLEDDFEEEETGFPIWLLVLLAVLGIILIVVIIVLIVRQKKKKEAELFDDEDEYGEDDIENEDF
ncbi:MAG: hypothetical protein K2L07_07255 [Lachnospiraceae bacterium]|nr:hypothetical protein [Lachnospiraceae bacterium]